MTKTHIVVCIMIIRLLRMILVCVNNIDEYTIKTDDIMEDSSDLILELNKLI